MTYPTTLIVAVLLCSTAAAAPQEVTCESPCSCSSAHGKGRWSVKNDPETPLDQYGSEAKEDHEASHTGERSCNDTGRRYRISAESLES